MIRQTIWGFKLLNIFQNFSYWRTCKPKVFSFFFFFFPSPKESDLAFARTKNSLCFLLDIRKKNSLNPSEKLTRWITSQREHVLSKAFSRAKWHTCTHQPCRAALTPDTGERSAVCLSCPTAHAPVMLPSRPPLQKGTGSWCSSADQGCLLRKHSGQPRARDLDFSPPEARLSSCPAAWVFTVPPEEAGPVLSFLQFWGVGGGEACSRVRRSWRQPPAAGATAGEGKAPPSLTAGPMPTLVLTKEFSAFQGSCFPGCQPRGKPLFSSKLDALSRGISPVGPISAWPAYLLVLTCGRGWKSLAPFELSMNKNNSSSQAWNDFEWNPGISQAIKWMGCYLVFRPTDAHLNMTLLFSRLFRHIPCSTRKEGLKGEVDIADLSRTFLIFLNTRVCFLWLQPFSDFEAAGLSFPCLVSLSASALGMEIS